MGDYEHKFKVFRLTDANQIEDTLNNFDLGVIEGWQVTMPDYRVVVVVIRYVIDQPKKPEAENDKATK